MPTVIDSLVVLLNLDPKNFTQGQRDAVAALKALDTKAEENAKKEGARQTAQQKAEAERRRREKDAAREQAKVEREAAKARAESYALAKNAALGFGAAIAELGLAKLVQDTASSVAATGRLAHNLDMSTASFAAFGLAVKESVGGSADAAGASLQGLSDKLVAMRTQGDRSLAPFFALLNKYGHGRTIRTIGPDGKPYSTLDVMRQISGIAQVMDPMQFSSFARQQGGMDDGTINLLEKGPAAFDAAYNAALKNAPTDKQAKADQNLENATNQLKDAFTRLTNNLVFNVAPGLTQFVKDSTSFLGALTGQISWADFLKQMGDHAHQRDVEANVLAGMSPKDAEAAATKSEHDRSLGLNAPGLISPGLTQINPPPPVDSGWVGDLMSGDFPNLWRRIRGRPPALAKDVEARVRADAIAAGLDPDMVAAQFTVEGGGYRNVSSAGAFGPAQLMPGTARGLGVAAGVDDPNYSWQANADAGVRLMAQLLKKHRGYAGMQAAYNAGPGGRGVAAFDATGDASGLPLETQRYLATINSLQAGMAAAGGATNHTSLESNIGTVHIHTRATDANGIAKAITGAIGNNLIIPQAASGLQ